MTDDYYELLGVDAEAPVDDIRAAYRDKKAAVGDREGDDAKADAAALNKAWNVLSDPYQRGRYDQQRLDVGDELDDDLEDDDAEDDAPARRTRTPRVADKTPPRKGARPPLEPTVKLPAGVEFPQTKARVTALLIDLVVLVLLFAVSAYVTDALERSKQPTAHHLVISVLPDQIKAAHSATSAAKKEASPNVDCTKPTTGKDKTYCDAKAHEQDLNDQFTAQSKKLAPIRTLVSGIYFLVALLVLLIPSLSGGQTIGKRFQNIRVVKMDGSRAGAAELFRRYGALALAAFVLSLLLQGPIGALIVVFVAAYTWTRNANRQGLQDRFAKTLVVTGHAE